MEKNLFELATRCKYRFPYRGQITIEDLWDLRLQDIERRSKEGVRRKSVEAKDKRR